MEEVLQHRVQVADIAVAGVVDIAPGVVGIGPEGVDIAHQQGVGTGLEVAGTVAEAVGRQEQTREGTGHRTVEVEPYLIIKVFHNLLDK